MLQKDELREKKNEKSGGSVNKKNLEKGKKRNVKVGVLAETTGAAEVTVVIGGSVLAVGVEAEGEFDNSL